MSLGTTFQQSLPGAHGLTWDTRLQPSPHQYHTGTLLRTSSLPASPMRVLVSWTLGRTPGSSLPPLRWGGSSSWGDVAALGKHHLPEPLLQQVLLRTAQRFSWLLDFLAAFIGAWLCLATSQDGLGCPLELAKHPSQNTEGSTSVLATPSETSFPQCPPTRSTLSRIPSISSKVPLGPVKVWSLSHESCGDSKTFGNRRRQWLPTPVLLPGKSHGWRSLVGCSPWGH